MKRDGAELSKILSLVVRAIIDYKKKNDIYLPGWVSEIGFKIEATFEAEITKAKETIIRLNGEAKHWRDYKGVLCTSGHTLNTIVVSILRTFFGFDLKSEERYIEDALIFGRDGKTIYVVEIKGVNGGVKRENVNQVDSHRERLKVSDTVPGLLIINDFMSVEDFEQRKKKQFDQEILAHARKTNVKILRTTTLIDMMLKYEDSSNRKDEFLRLAQKADPLLSLD